MTHDNGAYVKYADVTDRIRRLRAAIGKSVESAAYRDGYEDALLDLLDCLVSNGPIHSSLRIERFNAR